MIGQKKPCKNPDCQPGGPPKLVGPRETRRGLCHACYAKFLRSGTLKLSGNPLYKRQISTGTGEWDSEAEIDLLRDLGRKNFWFYFLHIFGAGVNPKGLRWIDPDIHRPIAEWFQEHIEEWTAAREVGNGIQKHLAFLLHREVGKTTMISQAGQSWLHLRDPDLSSYTGSEKMDLAAKIIAGVKSVFEGDDPYSLFARLYGNWAEGSRTWTARDVVHAARRNTSKRDPSLGTFGVETSIVGAHPDVIFYDDPISYERMIQDTNWLKSVNTQVTSLFPVIQSDGLVVWVGTRYDDLDHFGVAFKEEGVRSVAGIETDSIEIDPEGSWDVYFLAGRDKDGKPTTPKVWPEDRLMRYQRRDPLRYAAQIMNDPAISEFNPLTKEQIQQCLIDAKDVPWGGLRFGICFDAAFWDGKTRARKDETTFYVHGYPRNGSGDVYVVEGYGSPLWRFEDFAHRLVALVQRYRKQGRKIIGISDEIPMAGRKDTTRISLQNVFHDANEHMPPYFEFSRGGTNKVQRIVNAASFWVDGHVRIVRGSPGSEELMYQMSRIGQMMVSKSAPNDRADAHADAFQPQFYQPMKRVGPQRSPYDRDAQPIDVEGLDRDLFTDGEASEWLRENPRSPIR